MPPLSKGTANAVANAPESAATSPWIQVSWMPHTSLSQTSYVKLTIRAAFDRSSAHDKEWRVRAAVHGMAGTPLGLPTETPAARLRPLAQVRQEFEQSIVLIDGGCTHACVWEETIRLPIRWRDLPRDAYLRFEILGPTDEIVSVVENGSHAERKFFSLLNPNDFYCYRLLVLH